MFDLDIKIVLFKYWLSKQHCITNYSFRILYIAVFKTGLESTTCHVVNTLFMCEILAAAMVKNAFSCNVTTRKSVEGRLLFFMYLTYKLCFNNNNNNNNNVKTENEHWYDHVPKTVEASREGMVTILWNQQEQTDRTIPNKSDNIFRHNEEGTRILIGAAISGNRIVTNKATERILKLKDLTIEIQRMWNLKGRVIAAIIGATGTISKLFRQYLSNTPGKHEIKELQTPAILGTAHTLRKVLM